MGSHNPIIEAPSPPTVVGPEGMERWLRDLLAPRLGLAAAEIDADQRFSQYGLDPTAADALVAELGEVLAVQLPPTLLWEHPTLGALAAHLAVLAPDAKPWQSTASEAQSSAEEPAGEEPDLAIEVDRRQTVLWDEHQVNGTSVVAGAFYIEMARTAASLERGRFRDVAFHEALFVPSRGTRDLWVDLEPAPGGGQRFEIRSRAAAESASDGTDAVTLHASGFLEVLESMPVEAPGSESEPLGEGAERVDGATFYAGLVACGNRYGPAFQCLSALRRGTGVVHAELRGFEAGSVLAGQSGASLEVSDALALDACVQAVRAVGDSAGRAYVLDGFTELVVDGPLTRGQRIRAAAEATRGERDGLHGAVVLEEASGAPIARLDGVRLHFLEQAATDAAETLAVSANFTADPIRDHLEMWLGELGLPWRPEMAPYNQVFQQLLDPTSLVASNASGANVVLLRFEDWLVPRWQPADAAAEEALAADPRHARLANGLVVLQQNPHETSYVYREIFVDLAYQRHGVGVEPGDVVIDIGANIGLFSLFALQAGAAQIYSFEPAPPIAELLAGNLARYGERAKVFPCGMSGRDGEAELTFYPRSSVFSSFDSDAARDSSVIRRIVRNQLAGESEEEVERHLDELMAGRLEAERATVGLRSVSSVLRSEAIEHVDLLKIDAERFELDILSGIDDADWPKIRQVAIEVHEELTEGAESVLDRVVGLLKDRGFEVVAEEEELLADTGFYNVYARRADAARSIADPSASTGDTLTRNLEGFAAALGPVAERARVPTVVVSCAPSAAAAEEVERLRRAESAFAKRLATLPGTAFVPHGEVAELYPVAEIDDPVADELGHIPYRPAYFAALASLVARRLHGFRRPRHKVLAVDCDQTLWLGVCGEDGPDGVVIDGPRRALQEMLVAQQEAGVLICLVSKNEEADVWRVFDRRDDMPLGREHVLAGRINWQPKSENLRDLARELDLGLDSFVFLDDNPVECAEVQAYCPEVLSLEVPTDGERLESFLRHTWAFDVTTVTETDARRTEMYRESLRREASRREAPSFESFLAGLGLHIEVAEIGPERKARAVQLTQRTNQFNAATRRLDDGALAAHLAADGGGGRIVHVRDRFGDYGDVGLVLYRQVEDTLRVEGFLLSCRVLGRGVEHRMLAELGEIAVAMGAERLEILFRPSARNVPVRNFLAQVERELDGRVEERADVEGMLYTVDAERARSWEFTPAALGEDAGAGAEETSPPTKMQTTPAAELSGESSEGNGSSPAGDGELYRRVVENLANAEAVLAAVGARRQRRRQAAGPQPSGELEESLAQIWRELLHVDDVGADENFFEIGGTSLLAVRVASEVRERLGGQLVQLDLLRYPTLRKLASYLRGDTSSAVLRRGKERAARRRAAR